LAETGSRTTSIGIIGSILPIIDSQNALESDMPKTNKAKGIDTLNSNIGKVAKITTINSFGMPLNQFNVHSNISKSYDRFRARSER
jgi:hypothetical protein